MGDGSEILDSGGSATLDSDGNEIIGGAGDPCCCAGPRACYRYARTHYDCATDTWADVTYDGPVCMAVADAQIIGDAGWVTTGSYPTCTAKILVACGSIDCPGACGDVGDCPTETDKYDDPGLPDSYTAPCWPVCDDCCHTFHITSNDYSADPEYVCGFDLDFTWEGPPNFACTWGGAQGIAGGIMQLANCNHVAILEFPACGGLFDPRTGDRGSIDCRWYYSVAFSGPHCPGTGWTQINKRAIDHASTEDIDPDYCPDLTIDVTCIDAP